MTAFLDYLIIAFLLVWLVSSFFGQVDKPKILSYDFLYIVPVCRFFSPKPISKDVEVYAQGLNEAGYESEWHQLYCPKRYWYNFFWNPQHRLNKTIIALYQQMNQYEDAKHLMHLSTPYLTILNACAAHFSKDADATHVKFMYVKYEGYKNSSRDIAFLSNVHSI